MNRVVESKRIMPLWAISLLLVIPVSAWGQKKAPSAPAKSAPAQHSSAPSHSSAPTHSTTGGRTNTGAGHTTATGRTNTTTGRTNTPAGRTNTTTGRTNTSAGRTNTTTGRTNTTTGRTNTGAGRGNTTTGRTSGAAGRTNTNAGRPNAGTGARGNAGARPNTIRSSPAGRSVSLRGGGTANVRPNGSVRSIDRNGMHIDRGVRGGRTVVTTRNGATIVSHGRGGYVQRAYVTRGGRSYVSRTYVSHGVVHVGVYRSYYWGGHAYYGWHAGFYWHPGFYAWAWNPWPGPLAWGVGLWGWGGPWWGFYAGWWNPYPFYAGPAFWLTDYLIASQLQAAYAARQEEAAAADAQASGDGGGGGDAPAPAPASGQVTLTPEVKEAIAEEVKAQIAAQQAQAQQSSGSAASAPAAAPAANTASSDQVPPALDPAQRTFVVDTAVTAVNNGQECGLSSGDVLTRLTDTPDANNTVNVSVAASQKGDCGSGQTVAVKVDDLQEMYNHFADQLQNGMSEMAKKQGTNGMPKAPDTGTTASDVPPPKPDPSAAQDLQQQQQQADQTEAQVKQETAQGGGQ